MLILDFLEVPSFPRFITKDHPFAHLSPFLRGERLVRLACESKIDDMKMSFPGVFLGDWNICFIFVRQRNP